MRHWSQLATRNSLAKPVRTAGAIFAIALGVGAVVWVTCCYESVRRTVAEWAGGYVGKSQIFVESTLGKLNPFAQSSVEAIRKIGPVKHVVPELTQRLSAGVITKQYFDADPENFLTWHENLPIFDLQGIDPQLESLVRDRKILLGRDLLPEDREACLVEAAVAEQERVGVGDYLIVWNFNRPEGYKLEIVGVFERRKLAKFQRPLALVNLPHLQRIAGKFALITGIDILLKEEGSAPNDPAAPVAASPSPTYLAKVAQMVRREASKFSKVNVRDAGQRIRQIENAQSQQEIVLMLLSSVAMLTALFIILSTLSMGLIERVGQLGLLRCLGMTKWQMSRLIFYEVIPLGFTGITLGIPVGLALTWLTVLLVPDYFGGWAVSYRGILLAVVGGSLTTLAAALLPALAAAGVSPLEASKPRASSIGFWGIAVATALAVALFIVQHVFVLERAQRDLQFVYWATTSVVLLYLVYALLAPLCVWLASGPAVSGVAALLGLRRQILQDPIGHAVWRSAGICCGLMVGLSLIVALTVFNSGFRAGWQFPKKFPAAYMWSMRQLEPDSVPELAKIPGIAAYTVANAQNAIVEERPLNFMETLVRSVTWFLGCDPDTFFDIVQFEFVEGERETAIARLKQGGCVLIADDFARTRNKHVGDKVRTWIGARAHEFEVVGVIDSPALDVAASYFQAESEMRVAAVGSVIGTNEDMKRIWGIDGYRMVLLNFDLPEMPPPAAWPPRRDTPEGQRMPEWVYDPAAQLTDRWQRYRENEVLSGVKRVANSDYALVGSINALKKEIDQNLTNVTLLLSAVPAVALFVAAVGVANLMTANVTSRARQIAMLRAVGATRGQVLRMVFGEALVLGAIGSVLGVALGLHLAWNTSVMTARMWGFEAPVAIPWLGLAGAIALTVGLCIIAGLLPARHAARADVIDALHVA